MSTEQDDQKPSEDNLLGAGLPIGLPLGIAMGTSFGVALDNLALGISLGISFGVALSLAFGASRIAQKKKSQEGQNDTLSDEEKS